LGKFFPKDWNLSIPLYWEFGENISNPQFNPLDPDVRFNTAFDYQASDAARDSLRTLSQVYQKRRSINFTNVRKGKSAGTNEEQDLRHREFRSHLCLRRQFPAFA
jgi:cell surface protein SprA